MPDGSWMAILGQNGGNYMFSASKDGKMESNGIIKPLFPMATIQNPHLIGLTESIIWGGKKQLISMGRLESTSFQKGNWTVQTMGKDSTTIICNQEEIVNGTLVKSDFGNNIARLLRSGGDNIQPVLGADSTTSETHTIA